jgi:hypothetical protein
MAEYKRVCNFCHKDFIAQKYNTKYCCNRCGNLGHKMQVRQEKQNLFNENETYKRLLNKILVSLERIEMLLNIDGGIKEEIAKQDLLTIDEYCKHANIHSRTLRRKINKQEIKYTKKGNKIFIFKNQPKVL